jgi:hypothetical protein
MTLLFDVFFIYAYFISAAVALLREQPWDLTFNPQASKHLALLHVASFGQVLTTEDASSLNSAEKLINR